MRSVVHGGDRRRVYVERPADPVQHVHHVLRRIEPADAQGGQAVDLGKGAGHDDVVAGRHQFDAGFIVVAAHTFGIGRIEHQQHMIGQSRM